MKKTYYLFTILAACITATLITACDDDNKEPGGYVEEVIENPVTAITLSNITGNEIILNDVGSAVTVQVSATPANAGDIERYHYVLTSSNPKVFTVDNAGAITATGYGRATLNVVAKNNANISVKYDVVVLGTRVTSVTLANAYKARTVTMTNTAATFSLAPQVTVEPSNASVNTLRYTSSNYTVATVDANGVVTPIWAGTTDITVQAIDGSGASDVCHLTVNITPITTLVINNTYKSSEWWSPSSLNLAPGTAATSAVQYLPANATRNTLKYTSSDPTVAIVNASGAVTSLKTGTTTIRVETTDGSGLFDECVLNFTVAILPRNKWNVIESSGISSPTYPLTYLIDDDASSTICRLTKSTSIPKPWFVVDMGEAISFDYIILRLGSTTASYLFTAIELLGSNNNEDYTSLGSVAVAATTNEQRLSFPASSNYRYIKASFTPTNTTSSYLQVRNFGLALTTFVP
jgi:uncharacterized protein YjdB